MIIKRIIDVILFYRVKDWPHLLGITLLGFVYNNTFINFYDLATAIIIGSSYLAHGYSLNDIYDNQVKIKINSKTAIVLSLIALIFCLIISSFVSITLLFIVSFGHLCGMLYSIYPFRFKNKLFLDLVFNSLSLAPLFLIGYFSAQKNITTGSLLIFMLFSIYFVIIQLVHEMQDLKIDIQYHQKNTLRLIGIQKTKQIIFLASFTYIVTSIVFFKLNVFRITPATLSIVFAIMVISYIHQKNITQNKLENNKSGNLKLEMRYLSIIYGISLLISFYLNF